MYKSKPTFHFKEISMKHMFIAVVLMAALLFLIPTLVLAQGEPDTTPPNISALDAAPADDGSATVSWTTDEPSDSRVDYGTSTSSLDQSSSDPASTTSHSLKLTELQAGTTYYYRVSSTDADNNTATSPPSDEQPASFEMPPTPPAEVPPVTDPSIVIAPFAWFFQDPRNYAAGILFLVVGAAGALATTFFAVGDVMPGTAGAEQFRLRAQNIATAEQLAKKYLARAEELREDPTATEEKINWYTEQSERQQRSAGEQQTQLDNERRRQFSTAYPIFVGLGGVFATMLAQDVTQALIIGAAWPTVYGSYKLKQQVQSATANNATLQQQVQSATTAHTALKQEVAQTQPALQEMQRILTPIVNDPQNMLGNRTPDEISPSMNNLKELTEQVEYNIRNTIT
jgi:hypothetical protein